MRNSRALALPFLLATAIAAPPWPQARPAPAAPSQPMPLPVAGLRVGVHPGYGRLVIDLPPGAAAAIETGPDWLRLHLDGAEAGQVPRLPPNVTDARVQGGTVLLHLAPGARWRTLRLRGRVVIDAVAGAAPIADAVAPAGRQPAPAPFSGPPPRAFAAPVSPPARFSGPPRRPWVLAASAPPPPAAAPRPMPPPRTSPAQPAPAAFSMRQTNAAAAPVPNLPDALPAMADAPSGLTVARHLADGRIALPTPRGTGLAAFRRGAAVLVVLDARVPFDPASLAADPTSPRPLVDLLPAATVLTFAIPPGQTLRAAPLPGGWALTVMPASGAPPAAAIRADQDGAALLLAAHGAGRVVAVPDPAGGASLLVGTQSQGGEAIALGRRAPDFALLPTLQGVAVEPLSEAAVLRTAPDGFRLEAAPSRTLTVGRDFGGGGVLAQAARDFPDLPMPELRQRLRAAMDAAAAAPPQARGPLRLAVVQALLALGLDAEAQALATLAQADDPQLASAPDAAALAALGALLAGRQPQAASLDDARLNGPDEVALWRAVRDAMRDERSPADAQVFAATAPLVLAYPAPLRARLLPLMAETMVEGGEREAARQLLAQRPDDPALDYARTLLAEADGTAGPALAMLDRLARSPDRLVRARAAVRAAELRLRSGAFSPAQAADALDRLIYAWRGDGRELNLRLRVAELRAQQGHWREALAVLREAAAPSLAANWPDRLPELRTRMQALFAAALEADAQAKLPPMELVALVEENPDLLPPGEAGRGVAARLADRLVALDLPGRAIPLLNRLAAATPSGPVRAELGSRLAELQLGQGDAAAALATLAASDSQELPADLAERRTIVAARATAARGAVGEAVAALAALDSAAADGARADLLEAAKDWPAATAALTDYVRRAVPQTGPLDPPAARTVLRLASAAAQAGDEATLQSLRERDLPRFPPGGLSEMLRMLTEPPVREVADLPRAAREEAQARRLPQEIGAAYPAAAAR
jgi:hypothetical protein